MPEDQNIPEDRLAKSNQPSEKVDEPAFHQYKG